MNAIVLNRRPERLDRLADECLARLAEEAGAPAVARQIAPGIPEYPMDPALMKEVLECLLREAASRSEAGTRLRVTVKANRNALMFSVKAPGPGLTDAERESLFSGQPLPGTLVRARAIVAAHGGVTWANGLPGKGITYYFSLPIRRHAAPHP